MTTSITTALTRTRWISHIPGQARLKNWLEPHIKNPGTFFRERTIRVFSVGFLIISLLAIPAAGFLYLSLSSLTVLLLVAIGAGSSMMAIHQQRLGLASLVLAATFMGGAYYVLIALGYESRLTFPGFMLAFVLWTLVLPRNSLWPLLLGTIIAAGIIIILEAAQQGTVGFGAVSDLFVVLLLETLGLYTFRLEFDNRLEAAEEARSRAELADKLKTQFLSNVSHEFRTPLNAINGYNEIMLSGIGGTMSERHLQFSKKIHANTEQLRLMVDDLLDLARIESGSLQIITELASPRDLVANLVDEKQGLTEGKSVILRTQIGDNLPETVKWDTRKVQQVLTNLIGNAVKFTDQGVVEVCVKAVNEKIQLSVMDTGVGMPADASTYIFEKFRQVDSTEGRKHGGNGLGLSITKGLVEQMGGSILVQSELGKGSTFTVTLPQQMEDTIVAIAK